MDGRVFFVKIVWGGGGTLIWLVVVAVKTSCHTLAKAKYTPTEGFKHIKTI